MNKKSIQIFLLIILIGVFLSIPSKKQSITTLIESIKRFKDPCSVPITYSLGVIDSNFDLKTKDILTYIQEAENIWEKPSGKNLFQYKEDGSGDVKINFTFDKRQANTEKLGVIKGVFTETEESYQKQKDLYESLVTEYNTKNLILKGLIENYKIMLTKYNQEVSYWNSQGGVPREKMVELEAERTKLGLKQKEIESQELALKTQKNQLESYYSIIDKIYNSITKTQKEYNTLAESSSEEFHAGEYNRNEKGTSIDVYQFETKEKLIRLLAHELGHALGIEHTKSPNSIMYYLNSEATLIAETEDLGSLEKICQGKK